MPLNSPDLFLSAREKWIDHSPVSCPNTEGLLYTILLCEHFQREWRNIERSTTDILGTGNMRHWHNESAPIEYSRARYSDARKTSFRNLCNSLSLLTSRTSPKSFSRNTRPLVSGANRFRTPLLS